MAKNNRREVAKRLTQEIAVTKDPETLIELSRQLAKFQPKKRRQSKPDEETPKKNNHSSILDNRTGSMVDNLSDGKKVIHHLVVELEKRERNTGQTLTQTERHTFWEDLISSLSERERAAFNNDEVA